MTVEEINGSRARVRTIHEGRDLEGWIRLCTTDGMPHVQPVDRSARGKPSRYGLPPRVPESEKATPSSSSKAAGAAVKEEMEKILIKHGTSSPDAVAVGEFREFLEKALAVASGSKETAASWQLVLEKIAFETHRRRVSEFQELELFGALDNEEFESWEAIRSATENGLLPIIVQKEGSFVLAHSVLQDYLFAARSARVTSGGVDGEPPAEAALPSLRMLLSEQWWVRGLEFLAVGWPTECTTLIRRLLEAWEARRGGAQMSALHLAVERGSTDLARLMLEHGGVSPNGPQHRTESKRSSMEETPLFRAVSQNAADLVELLISHNADVGGLQCTVVASAKEQRTPLLRAVERGHLESVQLLVKNGADINGPQLVVNDGEETKTCKDVCIAEDISQMLCSGSLSVSVSVTV